MRQKLWRGIIGMFLLSNVALLVAQTETFPRWRLVGGRSGVPVEMTSDNAMLTTLTGVAAQADDGTAATLPRYRLAGGTTGNLAEVDSTGHLLVAAASGSGLASTGSSLAQFAPTTSAELATLLTDETGTAGFAVFSASPTFTGTPISSTLQLGSTATQFNALLSARYAGNGIEFGHDNPAGFGSMLGAEAGTGKPFLCFNCSRGSTANTYLTTGIQGVVIRTDAAGALSIDSIATASADNQTPTNLLSIAAGGQLNIPGTKSLLFGDASASGALLRYNSLAGELVIRRGDNSTFGAFVSTSSANKFAGITTLRYLIGATSTGTNTASSSLVVESPVGTGTGDLGTTIIKGALTKAVSGSGWHQTIPLLTIGNTQTAHPGTAGAVADFPAVTWTDFNTANSGTAAVASAYVFSQPTFAATGTSVTTTKAATVSILDAPTNGTNMTLSTSFALDVVTGAVRIGDLGSIGAATGKTQICSDSTGKLFRSASGYSCETTNAGPGTVMELIYCGQAAENGTIYLSPAAGIKGATIGARPELASVTCDALDGATEATQDIIIFPNNAFRVTGMYCMQNGAEVLAAGESIIFTYRANAADVTPSVTCTIGVGASGCASAVVTTTDVAANLPTAMQAVMSSNNSDQDLWCSVSILVQP